MNSPHLQLSSRPHRVRTNSNLSVNAASYPGGVRKRSTSHSSSNSGLQADRLQNLALEDSNPSQSVLGPTNSAVLQWISPQHCPRPHTFPEPVNAEPFSAWTAPTPPRSDSGLPTVSVDANEDSATSGVSSSRGWIFEPQPTNSANMSSLGFLLPSQYGTGFYESEPSSFTMDQTYIPTMRKSHPTNLGQSASMKTTSSSPALYQSRPALQSSQRRHSELPLSNTTDQTYNQSYRRISNPYDSVSNGYSTGSNQIIPSISGLIQSPLPSPHIGATTGPGLMSQYSRSTSLYGQNMYGQPFTTVPSGARLYAPSQSMNYPPSLINSNANEVQTKPLETDSSIRVLQQRPKPQCWEHGCNGRQFSTFSNLLRHQREKSGAASKSYCPKCGAEFTRTTARNGHLAHDKCTRNRRPSEEKQ